MTITQAITAAVSAVALALAGCAEPESHTRVCTVDRKLDDMIFTHDCGVLRTTDYDVFKQFTSETKYQVELYGDHIVTVEKLPSLHDKENRK